MPDSPGYTVDIVTDGTDLFLLLECPRCPWSHQWDPPQDLDEINRYGRAHQEGCDG